MWNAPRCYSVDPIERGGGAYNFNVLVEVYTTVWRQCTLRLVAPSFSNDCFYVCFECFLGSGGWRGLPSLCVLASHAAEAL